MQSHSKRGVSYFYNSDIGNFHYGANHPMEPMRISMTHDLVLAYKLYQKMEVYRPNPAVYEDLQKFHTTEYLNFLEQSNDGNHDKNHPLFNIDADSPVFPGVFEFSCISAGGSLAAAVRLNKQNSDICINWGGGLHHAKRNNAAGFCYVNDIVLAILELLKYYARVLYIDIDVHHGDGVIEAFFSTNRVLALSFHKYGDDYFPGSGHLNELGHGQGHFYTVNVPLNDGITDNSFKSHFEDIVSKAVEVYQPSVIVMQCGADSLTGDLLGCFNLTLKGHGHCVNFVKNLNLPLLLLGGGGYTISNVARCWTYETAIALDTQLSDTLPPNNFAHLYGPSNKLHIRANHRLNRNNRIYLQQIKMQIFENLRNVEPVPSVQMYEPEADAIDLDEELSQAADINEDVDCDTRTSTHSEDICVVSDTEFYENDQDQDKHEEQLPLPDPDGPLCSGAARKRSADEC